STAYSASRNASVAAAWPLASRNWTWRLSGSFQTCPTHKREATTMPTFTFRINEYQGLLVLSLLACIPILGCGSTAAPVPGQKLLKVQVSRVERRPVTDYEDFTGRTEAPKYVEIRARVTGHLKALHFDDGADVQQGQLLFEIDPLPLRATLNQTEAN